MAQVRVSRLAEDAALGAALGTAAGLTIANNAVEGFNDLLGLEGLTRQVPRLLVGSAFIAYALTQPATSGGLPRASIRLPAFTAFWLGVSVIFGQAVRVEFPFLQGGLTTTETTQTRETATITS